ncbi:hypothetical protein [Paenibacillus rigui]|nr:hypothetical protein [Paenibacillus rigui]
MKATLEKDMRPLPQPEDVPEDEATLLLERQGFTVLRGKQRIPLEIAVNDDIQLQSRLFIDYFVERDGQMYTVKLAKDRKPLEMTGSSVRDQLLVYQLLYPRTAGVIYLDTALGKAAVLTFALELDQEA